MVISSKLLEHLSAKNPWKPLTKLLVIINDFPFTTPKILQLFSFLSSQPPKKPLIPNPPIDQDFAPRKSFDPAIARVRDTVYDKVFGRRRRSQTPSNAKCTCERIVSNRTNGVVHTPQMAAANKVSG